MAPRLVCGAIFLFRPLTFRKKAELLLTESSCTNVGYCTRARAQALLHPQVLLSIRGLLSISIEFYLVALTLRTDTHIEELDQ